MSGGSGTGVQDSQTVHFGLGQIQSVDVRVYFLGGNIVEISDVSTNTKIWVHEDGTLTGSNSSGFHLL